MTSRRTFPSNAFGIAFVPATTWPIRADQARSTQRQSNTSRSKAGRTTRKTSLRWDVFLAPNIPAIASDLPPGVPDLCPRASQPSATAPRFVGSHSDHTSWPERRSLRSAHPRRSAGSVHRVVSLSTAPAAGKHSLAHFVLGADMLHRTTAPLRA